MAFTHPSCNIRKLLLYFGFFLGLVCVFLFCFYHLSYDELKSFDEARHGVSAYEMLQTGEPIVTTYAYSPDYWNLKPPLSEWLIALGYKLFGYNALGIRFYSAFSIFLAALLCALYLWKRHNALASIFCLFLFPTFGGLFSYHGARAADADSLFILFYVAAVLCMCKSRDMFRWVYIACLCFALAFLTKSFHAGLIAIFVLCALLCLGHFNTMRLTQYLLCAFCSLFPVGCWGLARYLKDGTSFLIPMFAQDVVNRSANAIDGHSGSWRYYFSVIFRYNDNNSILLLFLLCLVFIGFILYFQKESRPLPSFLSSDFFLFALGILIPLIIFTIAKTKLINYIYCVYPLMALIASVSLSVILKYFPRSVKIVITTICFVLTLFVVQKNFRTIIPVSDQHDYSLQTLLLNSEIHSGDCVYIAHDFESYGAGYDWTQAQVMEAEWLTDCVPQFGGIDAFEANSHSYLIVSNSLTENLSSYEVICKTDSYSILYNP